MAGTRTGESNVHGWSTYCSTMKTMTQCTVLGAINMLQHMLVQTKVLLFEVSFYLLFIGDVLSQVHVFNIGPVNFVLERSKIVLDRLS